MKRIDRSKLLIRKPLVIIAAFIALMMSNTMSCAAPPNGGEFLRDNLKSANRDKSGTNAWVKKQRAPQTTCFQKLAEHITIEAERAGFEPAVQTSCTRHFQCRSLSHSDTSPGAHSKLHGNFAGGGDYYCKLQRSKGGNFWP